MRACSHELDRLLEQVNIPEPAAAPLASAWVYGCM